MRCKLVLAGFALVAVLAQSGCTTVVRPPAPPDVVAVVPGPKVVVKPGPVVVVGHRRHRHCWWHHGHRHCRP